MMNHDLTKGNVTKSLLLFAAPMILGNLLQQCYNIADTWVVGKFVGADALAAVGSSYALMTFLNSLLIGLCMGSGAVFSYYIGKGDRERVRICAQTAFVMIGMLAVALTGFSQAMVHPILMLLRTPSETVASAAPESPRPRLHTKNKSRTIFKTEAAPRKYSGATELPSARSRNAK